MGRGRLARGVGLGPVAAGAAEHGSLAGAGWVGSGALPRFDYQLRARPDIRAASEGGANRFGPFADRG